MRISRKELELCAGKRKFKTKFNGEVFEVLRAKYKKMRGEENGSPGRGGMVAREATNRKAKI